MTSKNFVKTFEELKTFLIDFFKEKVDIDVVLVYGSFAKGKQNENSDVDIAIHSVNGKISIDDLVEMQVALSLLLGREVDLVDLRGAEGYFLYEIMTQNKRIIYKPEIYVHYLMEALYFYEDFMPILRECQKVRINRFLEMEL